MPILRDGRCAASSGRSRQPLGGLLAATASRPHAHDVALLHDQELDAVDLDLGARPLAEQHAVAEP